MLMMGSGYCSFGAKFRILGMWEFTLLFSRSFNERCVGVEGMSVMVLS